MNAEEALAAWLAFSCAWMGTGCAASICGSFEPVVRSFFGNNDVVYV